LWAKLLAEEANSPGGISKQTVNLLSSLDKTDALLFTDLCRFIWWSDTERYTPIIYDYQNPLHKAYGINFDSLRHLDSLGLINFQANAGYALDELPELFQISYHGVFLEINFSSNIGANNISIGHAMLTRAGTEIVPVCNSQPMPDYFDYVLTDFVARNLIISSPYPSHDVGKPIASP
jgi:hypothetical protein